MNSILIGLCTYNHYEFTKLALESLWKNTPKLRDGSARLVVIDNNSTDGTVENILRDFPWIPGIIHANEDCISKQWNTFLEFRKPNEDFLMIPNDVVFGPNWLELLREDTYRYDNVIVGSPYLPVDLAYDKYINEAWANRYKANYELIRNAKSAEELRGWMQSLYGKDFDQFCLEFQERNKDEPPIDCAVTHVLLFKAKLFDEHNFKFSEEYCPYYGSHEFDTVAQLNNLGYFRIASSRSYVHHWISISNKTSDIPLTEKQKIIDRNNLTLLKKWTPIPGSQTFLEGPRPSAIPNFRMPYYKFKLNDPYKTDEEARKMPGIKFMSFEGLTPGVSYFDQIKQGSIVRKDYKSYKVKGWTSFGIVPDGYQNGHGNSTLTRPAFIEDGWHIDYFWREEEERYFGQGHQDCLLEK